MGILYSRSAFCILLCIPDVDTVSPADSTTMLQRSSQNVDLCERYRVLGEREFEAIPMATLRREEIDDVRTKNNYGSHALKCVQY